ncbi:MAG TPA: tetratricopeptide repeat protein [Candidatus Dormibacteraeota bacterium]|nr:tetratricopeptide repeat protein [Candidatus Dormibacteraeota bacterium]
MQKLEPPEIHHLSAAIGWLGLGNVAEAKAELTEISEDFHNHPDVLEARWLISADEKNWEEGLEIARSLLHHAPDRCSGWLHQAYALRRVPDGSVKKAWTALLPAFDKFPKEAIVSYNLSCYACQLELLDAARVWLKRAAVIGGAQWVKKMALEDTDLETLWPEIKDGALELTKKERKG